MGKHDDVTMIKSCLAGTITEVISNNEMRWDDWDHGSFLIVEPQLPDQHWAHTLCIRHNPCQFQEITASVLTQNEMLRFQQFLRWTQCDIFWQSQRRVRVNKIFPHEFQQRLILFLFDFRQYFDVFCWLVVWSILFFSISWECHHPNWRALIFFRGFFPPPTSLFPYP